MADLKAGTTIGGTLVWTQGNFPLFPTGNTLVYKTFKVYSENDKPQAIDNDFVSKAQGGTYQKTINVNGDVILPTTVSGAENGGGLKRGNGDGATLAKANIDITSWYGVGIVSTSTNERTIVFDARTGNIVTVGYISATGPVLLGSTPSEANHATRKDYVDTLINNVTTNANDRVSKAGDTMRGNLTAPNFISINEGTQPTHVVRYSQVVLKGTILDYGRF